MPYDPTQSLEQQIHASVAYSLQNLRQDDLGNGAKASYIDCFLLHSPLDGIDQTLEAWTVLQGICNTSLPVLKILYDYADIKPSVVQNRFYSETKYDISIREFCRHRAIRYQAYWTLTGNASLLGSPIITEISNESGVAAAIALYCLIQNEDITVLNGTSSIERMSEDMEGIVAVQNWSREKPKLFSQLTSRFRDCIASDAELLYGT